MQLQLESETSLSPEQALAALTDFSARRPQMWTGISPQYYEVSRGRRNQRRHSGGDQAGGSRCGPKSTTTGRSLAR